MRGSGCSQGYLDPLSATEARDGYDVIEWAAAQPWSDGTVAMYGLSYVGMVQYFVAALHPPHLVTIMPMQTHGDAYRDILYPGGIDPVARVNTYMPLNAPATNTLHYGEAFPSHVLVPIVPSAPSIGVEPPDCGAQAGLFCDNPAV